mgnify:FL=1
MNCPIFKRRRRGMPKAAVAVAQTAEIKSGRLSCALVIHLSAAKLVIKTTSISKLALNEPFSHQGRWFESVDCKAALDLSLGP